MVVVDFVVIVCGLSYFGWIFSQWGPVRLLYRHRAITITFLYCISVHALYSDNYSDLFHLNDAFKRSFLERFKVILIQMDLWILRK